MKRSTAAWRCVAALFSVLALWGGPVLAQYPVPECDPAAAPANASIPAALLSYCSSGSHPGAQCDLSITEWDAVSERSPDLRVGDPFNPSGPSAAEDPRFFLDVANNRFYTKLYVRFRNAGGGAGAPAPATEVKVDFFYKLTSNPADRLVPTGWIEAGTVIASPAVENTYQMNIPAPAPIGALFPGLIHHQQRGVCWSFASGTTTLPLQFLLKAEVTWTEDGNQANDIAYGFYDLSSLEPKAQIGLVMDLSGSMDDSFIGGNKLAKAREKAALFTTLVENGNQLGVYGFATGNPANTSFTAAYTDTSSGTQNPTLTHTSQIAPIQNITSGLQRLVIAASILGQSAHGCTPVGQGLLRARKAFGDITPPAGAKKAIVLFSDGLQNVKPFVEGAHEPECAIASGNEISTVQNFKNENIEIYVVFFGDETLWAYNVMYDIQDDTGGKYIYGTATDLELANAYYAIRGLVDDMLYYDPAGSVPAGGPWPTFEVPFDGGVRTATVAVTWPYDGGQTKLALFRRPKLQKPPEDGRLPPWSECQEEEADVGDTSNLDIVTPVPPPQGATSFQVCRFTPGADTTWEFEVRQVSPSPRTGSTPYSAAAFSAVQAAQLVPSLVARGFETGKPLPLFAELRSGGAPLTGATVDAVVQVPARSLSTLLRGYAGRFSDPDSKLADQPVAVAYAQQLKQFVRADEGSAELYRYRDVPVSLRDDGQGRDRVAGDGIYSGELPASETEVAGDYRVTITAQATLASGRTVRRVARLSAICNVGPPDPAKSRVTSIVNPDPVGGAYLATVTVLPTDRFGNAAFPGSGSQIQLRPGSGVVAIDDDLVDRYDTTFTQRVRVSSPRGARIDVSARGVDLGSHAIGGGAVAAQRELSFHLGVATPHGRFGRFASAGPSLGLDYIHRFGSSFALRGELARDEFDLQGGGSVEQFNLSAYLRHQAPRPTWSPYFEIGAGIYDFENAGSALGFAVSVGVQRELGPRWDLDLNWQDHRVGGSLDLHFSRARVGAIYKF